MARKICRTQSDTWQIGIEGLSVAEWRVWICSIGLVDRIFIMFL